MTTQMAPESMYRSTEGLGIWEHRGKVAAVGIGTLSHRPPLGWQGRNLRRRVEHPGAAQGYR